MLTLHRVLLALAPRLRVPNPIDARMLSHDPDEVRAYRTDPLVQGTISASVLESFLRGMARAQAEAPQLEAPMLMLVAGADRVVDPQGSRAFHDHAPPDLRDMVWNVPDMLAFLSQLYRLEPGDLVFTGTPAGVGAVVVGDRLEGRIAGLTPLAVEIVAAVD